MKKVQNIAKKISWKEALLGTVLTVSGIYLIKSSLKKSEDDVDDTLSIVVIDDDTEDDGLLESENV